jgi:ribosomal protein L25 (general stress protein Ctc)
MTTATSSRPTLAAEPREVTGKKVALIRREGRLRPSSSATGSIPRTSPWTPTEFDLLRRRVGQNALIDLSVHGDRPVLVQGIQVHPVNRRALHVDRFLVRMTEELTVDVPLVAIGTSKAIEDEGGTLLHPIEHVRIKALPDHLPQSIEYSIDTLVDFDAVIKVSDLAIPSDVTSSPRRRRSSPGPGTARRAQAGSAWAGGRCHGERQGEAGAGDAECGDAPRARVRPRADQALWRDRRTLVVEGQRRTHER